MTDWKQQREYYKRVRDFAQAKHLARAARNVFGELVEPEFLRAAKNRLCMAMTPKQRLAWRLAR